MRDGSNLATDKTVAVAATNPAALPATPVSNGQAVDPAHPVIESKHVVQVADTPGAHPRKKITNGPEIPPGWAYKNKSAAASQL